MSFRGWLPCVCVVRGKWNNRKLPRNWTWVLRCGTAGSLACWAISLALDRIQFIIWDSFPCQLYLQLAVHSRGKKAPGLGFSSCPVDPDHSSASVSTAHIPDDYLTMNAWKPSVAAEPLSDPKRLIMSSKTNNGFHCSVQRQCTQPGVVAGFI